MWGTWIGALMVGVGMIALVIGLAFAVVPLFAVAAVLVLFPFIFMALRREPGEPGSRSEESEREGGKPTWMTKRWYE